MEKLKILVVEDDFLQAEDMIYNLNLWGYEVTNHVDMGENVLSAIQENKPDLILMDIDLAGKMDGIQTATEVNKKYQIPIIYLTGLLHPKLYERAKPTRPSAYLLKGDTDENIFRAIDLALHNFQEKKSAQPDKSTQELFGMVGGDEFIFIRQNQTHKKLYLKDILWVEGMAGNGIKIQTADKEHLLFSVRPSDFEKREFSTNLMRVHRSWIVNFSHIDEIEGRTIYIGKQAIPIGEKYWNTVRKRLNFF